MARLYLTILAIFAMIYSAAAFPAIRGRQLGWQFTNSTTVGGALPDIPFPPNGTFPAPNGTFPAPNGTVPVPIPAPNGTNMTITRTRRSLRSFPISLPVPYKA